MIMKSDELKKNMLPAYIGYLSAYWQFMSLYILVQENEIKLYM